MYLNINKLAIHKLQGINIFKNELIIFYIKNVERDRNWYKQYLFKAHS